MSFRVGIVALLHESNTFIGKPTTLDHFARDLLVEGDTVREKLGESLHEVGGFFRGIAKEQVEAVPIFAARALPYGTIATDAAEELVRRLLAALDRAGKLDGLLVAPHGAAVAEAYPDFDGYWLSLVRERVGAIPIIGTLDLHANLSPKMVATCDALIAYRTNPHLDQLERGIEAATLMARTLRGGVKPTMAAAFPPLSANIERQATAEPHWRPLLDFQANQKDVLSSSLVYGFPYSDVPELGSAAIAVTDNDRALAKRRANELADEWWKRRADFAGELISVSDAVDRAEILDGPVCLLEMGDNVGGGSPADSTIIAHELHHRKLGPSLVVLFDPESVATLETIAIGDRLQLAMGGKTDDRHGAPLEAEVELLSRNDGKFEETEVRHGGIRSFDQGRTAVVRTDTGLTVVLTSRRMAPFSLHQITSCGLDPKSFRILVAKGVHAPVAAYAPVCKNLIRVNTPGTTTADMRTLHYEHRRRPLYPFERSAD
jgi:microcystin degradation protein MlrC